MRRLFIILCFCLLCATKVYAQSNTIELNNYTNNHSYSLCDGIFRSGTYSNNVDYWVTFCPSTSHRRIMLSFSAFNLQPSDRMIIYQGSDTLAPLKYTFSNVPYFTNTDLLLADLKPEPIDTSGCLTVRFKSNNNTTSSYWNANISCESLCQDLRAALDSVFQKYDALGNMTIKPVKHLQEIDSVTGDTIKYNAIDFCNGDSIVLIAKTIFPYNDISYHQSDSSCIFRWNFGDGHSDSAMYYNKIGHKWNDDRGYNLNLAVYDTTNEGCLSANTIDTRIRVSRNPISSILPLADICSGDTLKIGLDSVGFNQTAHESYSVKTFIPDGSCGYQTESACYESPVNFTSFVPGSTIQSGNEILSVVMNAEHSFLGDLGFWLICPNGQSVTLKYNTHSGGADLGIPNMNDDSYNRCDTLLNPSGIGWTYGWSNQYLTNQRGVIDGNNYARIDSTDVYNNTGYFQTPQQNVLSTTADLTGFNSLVGCPLNGIWRLRVCDNWGQDNGYVFSWNMTLRNSTMTDWTYKVLVDTLSFSGPFASERTTNSSLITPPADTSGLFLYNIHVVDNFGCVWDSISDVDVVGTPIFNLSKEMNICSNSSITLDAGNPNATSYTWRPTGEHTRTITINPQTSDSVFIITVVNSNNNIYCSGIDTLKIKFNPVYESDVIYDTICNGEVYSLNGFNQNKTGFYFDTLQSINGCDSINKLNLMVYPVFDTTITAEICNGETYSLNGFNQTTAGLYIDTLQTIHSCDSIIRLVLKVNPLFDTTITAAICNGEVYSLNGFNVGIADIYSDTLQSISGCDSIVKLNLTVYPKYDTTIRAVICQGELYSENGFTETIGGRYIDTLQSVNGCDSIVRLNLTVNPTYHQIINAQICSGEAYTLNGFNKSETGVYVDSLQTIKGCDSVVTLNLRVNPVYDTSFSASICRGERFDQWGFNFVADTSGLYIRNLQSISGCDSIVKLNLTVYPKYDTTIRAVICQGERYSENGFTETIGGRYIDTLQSVNGCDSIVRLNLTVNPTYHQIINAQICSGETYTLNGFNKSETGVYVDSLQTIKGCDSVVTLNLRVNPVYDTSFSASICRGERFAQWGFTFVADTSGLYIRNLQSISGCDSIVKLNLTVYPKYDTTIVANICQGLTYSENGFEETQNGVYTHTLQSINGCDSIVRLNLHVSVLHTEINDSICQGMTYEENGFSQTETGIYIHKLQTDYGCDSIVTLNLSVLPVYDTTINIIIDSGSVFNDYGITASQDGTYQGIFTNPNGCEGQITVKLLVDRKVPLFIPNAFTPLKDRNNTFCYYTDEQFATVQTFEVYNRWGQKIFEMTDQTPCWDGKYNGKVCETGAYIYKISYTTYFTGTRHFYKQGIVNLIR